MKLLLLLNSVFIITVLLLIQPHKDFAIIYKCPPAELSQRCDFTLANKGVCLFEAQDMVGFLSDYNVDIVCSTGLSFFSVSKQIIPVLKEESVFTCKIISKIKTNFCITIEPRHFVINCYTENEF